MVEFLHIQCKIVCMNLNSYRSLIRSFFVFFLLGSSIFCSAQYQTARLFDGTNSDIKGYLEYLPDDYTTNPNQKYPIMIFLHGTGERGNGTSQISLVAVNGPPKIIAAGQWPSSFQQGNNSFKFIVISPQTSTNWNAPDIDYIMNQVQNIYGSRIDQNRIYITGLSLGGGGVMDFLAENSTNSKSIAAAVTCAASSWYGSSTRVNNIAQNNLPIWFFHNEFDNVVNYLVSVNWAQNLDNAGINPLPKLTIYPGVYAHDSWSATYDVTSTNPNKVYEWMLGYTRGNTPPPPVSNAGLPQIINLPSSVTLDGSASSSPSGSIVSYQWAHVTGNWGDVIVSPNSAKTTVNFRNPGIYTYDLTVTDNNGVANTSSVTIYVNSAGAVLPIANAGLPQTQTYPYGVNLKSAGSNAPSGFIQTYFWTKLSGPAGDVILNPSQQNTNITFTYPGTYVYALIVTDGNGNSSMSTVTIQEQSNAQNPPVASIVNTSPGSSIILPSNASLDGSGSTDPSGSISSYSWSKISGPAGDQILSPNASKTSISFTNVGNYVYQLLVKDNSTGLSNSSTISLNVIGSPISVPGNNQSLVLPSQASLNGSGSTDPSGSITSYLWTKVSGPLGDTILNPSNPLTNIKFSLAGTYVYKLTVKDSLTGLIGNSNITVKVLGKPVSIAGTNQTIILPAKASLDGTASTDPSGSITQFIWSKISGPTGDSILNSLAAITNINFTKVGNYVYQLLVKDSLTGLSSSSTVNIKVLGSPVSLAGKNQTLVLPALANLDGTGSTDPSGIISRYTWSKLSGPSGDTVVSPLTPTTHIKFSKPGIYVYQLQVMDSITGLSSSSNITIKVLANPISVAGVNQTLVLPAQAILNGSGSSDPSGILSSYQWTKISGPQGDQILSPSSVSTNISFTNAGVYTYQLTVKDNADSLSGKSQVSITVLSNPVAMAGTNQTLILPAQALVDGSGSVAGSGSLVSYLWSKLSGPAGDTIQSPKLAKSYISFITSGIYTYQLTVKDNNGLSSSSTLQITVNSPILPPVSKPGSNQSLSLPSNASLDGSASTAPSGTLVSFLWTKISGPSGDSILNSHSAKTGISFQSVGTYVYQLTVVDNNGKSNNAQITITVNAAGTDLGIPITAGTPSYLVFSKNLSRTLINFGNNLSLAPSPWNNSTFQVNYGDSINLFDTQGNPTGVLSFPKPWSGADTMGVNTYKNSGYFPDIVSKSSFNYSKSDTISILLSGLNKTKFYTLSFFNSWSKPWSGAITNFMVGNSKVSLDASNNKDSLISIQGIVPDSTGSITIKVFKDSQAAAALINALIMDGYYPQNLVPATPILNQPIGISKTAISLSWPSVASTTEYYIYRSLNSSSNFSLIDSVSGSITSLVDSVGLLPGTLYYYELVAKNQVGLSKFSSPKPGVTLVGEVRVSFNSDQPAGSPWNDMNGGTHIPQLINTDGINTYVDLNIIHNFTGTNTLGSNTNNNSGIYPDKVLRGQYYVLEPDSAVIRISGLPVSFVYTFNFLSSWANPWAPSITQFRIGNKTVYQDPGNNSSKYVSISGILADSTGTLYITIKAKAGTYFGILNAMIIQAQPIFPGANSNLSVGNSGPARTESIVRPIVSGSDVHVYPMPFQTDFNLALNSSNAGHYKVTLYDVNGNTIYDEVMQNMDTGFNWRNMNFSGNSLKSGVYLLKIQSDQFPDKVIKIMKN